MVGWSHHLVSLVAESPPRGPLEVGVRAVSQVHSRMDAALPKLQASADPLSSPSQPSDLSLYLASLVFAHVDGTGRERVYQSPTLGHLHRTRHILQNIVSKNNRTEIFLNRMGFLTDSQITGESMREELLNSPQEGPTLALA